MDAPYAKAFESTSSENVRNVCIIAHVDHGKTCLADWLISPNGVIPLRTAGKTRYMDSRYDEQLRGITMKTSGITLSYGQLLINLLDSPGHVDFAGEVSTAALLSDIAILVIDVVEGVCAQTEVLLRMAINQGLDLIVVFNKIDKLIVELKMKPAEAMARIRRVLEQLNSCIHVCVRNTLVEVNDWTTIERLESKVYFSPEQENFIFASALHGYGFALSDFAKMWAEKLGIPANELQKELFSSSSYLSKGVIKRNADHIGKKTLFEQLVLEPLWELHRCGLVDEDCEKLKEMASKKNMTLRSKRAKDAFDEFVRSWLPLARACIRAVNHSVSAGGAFRRRRRLDSLGLRDGHPLEGAVRACHPDGITVVFVAKVLQCDSTLVAMCRILSGCVSPNTQLFQIGNNGAAECRTRIANVFMLRGRERVAVSRAVAGTVCALEIDAACVSSTLCSVAVATPMATNENGVLNQLVRVSVQSQGGSGDWDSLRNALRQLSLLDCSVRVVEQENGELALHTLGEMHLQKCLTDLEEMGQTNIKVSEPIVSFVETIVMPPAGTPAPDHSAECALGSGLVRIKVRAEPIPESFFAALSRNEDALRFARKGTWLSDRMAELAGELQTHGAEWLKAAKGSWWSRQSETFLKSLLTDRIFAFGPQNAPLNILLNAVEEYKPYHVFSEAKSIFDMRVQSLIAGFDLATGSGPLCEEPMAGVAIVVDEFMVNNESEDLGVSGAIISAMKQASRAALSKNSLRFKAAMYKCLVQTSTEALGKVHGVLSQKRAKVFAEELSDSGLFEISAYLPVIESFSFCEHLRKKTSGLASAQLQFSHWEILDEDPLWEPTTEDEVELYGSKGDSISRARVYMDMMRKRKGLLTDELIVVNAEKQRNLKRNK